MAASLDFSRQGFRSYSELFVARLVAQSQRKYFFVCSQHRQMSTWRQQRDTNADAGRPAEAFAITGRGCEQFHNHIQSLLLLDAARVQVCTSHKT